MRIGFIGIGAMGLPIACNLLKKGHEVIAFDTLEQSVRKGKENNLVVVESIKAVVENVEIIICSLPNSDIVNKVMQGENGVFPSTKSSINS